SRASRMWRSSVTGACGVTWEAASYLLDRLSRGSRRQATTTAPIRVAMINIGRKKLRGDSDATGAADSLTSQWAWRRMTLPTLPPSNCTWIALTVTLLEDAICSLSVTLAIPPTYTTVLRA